MISLLVGFEVWGVYLVLTFVFGGVRIGLSEKQSSYSRQMGEERRDEAVTIYM